MTKEAMSQVKKEKPGRPYESRQQVYVPASTTHFHSLSWKRLL